MPRFLVATLLLAASTLRAQPNNNVEIKLGPLPRGTVIVEFQRTPGATAASTLQRFRRDVADAIQRNPREQSVTAPIRYEYVQAMFGTAIDVPPDSLDAIRRLPYVRAIYPDRPVTAYAIGDAKPAAATIDAAARVNASSVATRGEGIRVGVIDTGIDYTHPALGGAFGPGHKVAGGWDFVNNDGDPKDDAGHGTHVAGIIAADSAEIAGVAPGVTLIAYKVLDSHGGGNSSDVMAAIERCIDPNQDGNPSDHLDVVNLSLGGPGNADDLVSKAVDNATAAGVVVVVAAGNVGLPDTIGSPGSARTAITVGALDTFGTPASYSSRAPSPGTLGFKPDVMAPGSSIPSTYLGGTIASLDGTSMATPHVTGAAALLRKLHPSWTPADVKSALVTTASRVNDAPLFRAAGRIDVAHADTATTFIDGAGISFGLANVKSGTWEAVRNVTMTNRSATAQSFDVTPSSPPPGMTLTATPSTLQLAPGESKSVELRLVVNGAIAAFTDIPYVDGEIAFHSGASSFLLPWLCVRAARVTVSYDSIAAAVLALSPSSTESMFVYDLGKAELFTKPDAQWDFLLLAYDLSTPRYALRMAFAENRTATSDSEVALHQAETTAEIVTDVRDQLNIPFDQLPGQINRSRALRFLYAKRPGVIVTIPIPQALPKLFLSPASSTFTFHLFDAYYDTNNGRAYNVQYPALSGITQPATFRAGPADYKRVRVHFPQPRSGPNAAYACLSTGIQTSTIAFEDVSDCQPLLLGPQMILDYFTTMESGEGTSGMDFDMGKTAIGKLRGIDGAIVPVPWLYPSPAAYRISDGEEITLGTSPLYAFSFFGTAPNRYIGALPGFAGPLGEWYRYVTQDTPWTSYNAANAQVAAGVYTNLTTCDLGPCDPGPSRQPGGRYVAARDDMNVAGQPSRGEVEVHFGSDPSDLDAPTLTTLRVLNGQGRLAEKLEHNSNASLFFAAGDYYYPPTDQRKFGSTRDLKREATKVFYRVHGAATWLPLTAVHQGSDLGAVDELRRFPAGEMYRADLAAATHAGADAVDLRIEIEDVAGNRTTWTQSPAIVLAGDAGQPLPPPSKRRSTRH